MCLQGGCADTSHGLVNLSGEKQICCHELMSCNFKAADFQLPEISHSGRGLVFSLLHNST